MIKKILYISLAVIVAYLFLGNLAHHVFFSEELADIHNYFKSGDHYISKWEGVEQTVLRQDITQVWVNLLMHEHSPGPPEHIHTGFDETFQVASGTLSILINGEKNIVHAGQSVHVPAGTPHKPFKETDSTVLITGENLSIPLDFAVYLSQVYGYFDADPDNEKMPGVMLQMSLFNQYFDSWLAQGPPIPIQKMSGFILRPLARLSGYRSYYPEFRENQE